MQILIDPDGYPSNSFTFACPVATDDFIRYFLRLLIFCTMVKSHTFICKQIFAVYNIFIKGDSL